LNLETAIKHALDGSAILFLGAGFSADARALNSRKQRLQTGAQLSAHLLKFAGIDGIEPKNAPPLDKASDYCRKKFKANPEPLIAELRALFSISSCAEWQKNLLACSWRRIYTTNYDDLPEFARSQESSTETRPKLVPVSATTDPLEMSERNNVCVHLNGYVHALNAKSLDSAFKLTAASYVDSSSVEGAWGRMLRSDITAARAVFFVGYSLYDLDLKRLLHEVPALADKTFFFLGTSSDPLAAVFQSEIETYGQNTGTTAEALADMLTQVAKSYIPPAVDRPIFSFPPITPPKSLLNRIPDTTVANLLVWGQIDPDALWSSLATPGLRYTVERTLLRTAHQDIMNGSGDLIVHADLGNGKTIFVESLALALAQSGVSVHRFEKLKSTTEDIKRLCETNERRVIIVENFLNFEDELRSLLQHRRSNISLVVTARTPEYQVRDSEWFDASGERALEYDLNTLDSAEILSVDQLLEQSGLWRDRAHLGSHTRQQDVRQAFESQFQVIVLELLRSKEMERRLKDYLDFEAVDSDTRTLIAGAFIANVLGFRFTLFDLAELCDLRVSSHRGVKATDVFNRVFDMSTSQVKSRSAIVAKHCLTRLLDPSVVTATLESFLKVCYDLRKTNALYKELFLQLSQFRNISKLLPADFEKESLYRHFEVLKTLGQAGDPLFWLQYAIARMFTRDLERADQYFQTAYSLAIAKKGFNAFQIDNHYARYLIEAAIETYDPQFARDAFAKAREIIERQIAEKTNRHYPFRIASKLYDFFLVYGHQMTGAERQTFLAASDRILKRAQSLDPQLQQHADVRRCIRALGQIAKQSGNDKSVDSKERTTPTAGRVIRIAGRGSS
jgi:SIR2-like domain